MSGRAKRLSLGRSGGLLPPARSIDAGLIVAICALAVFLAVLVGWGWLGAMHGLGVWERNLRDTATAILPPGTPPDRGLALLSAEAAIATARPISAEDTAALLARWLPTEAVPEADALPVLIAVTPTPSADRGALLALDARLAESIPGARLARHAATADAFGRAVTAITLLGAGVIALVVAAAALAVLAATGTRLRVHESQIVLLHSLGAPDGRIAGEIQSDAAKLALLGAAAGYGLAALAAWGLGSGWQAATGDAALPGRAAWLAMAISVPLTVALALVTARGAVLRRLHRLP